MKSTGIVRKVDELGRVVLPISLRRNFDIKEEDGLEIFVDQACIVLRKYLPCCIFCGSEDGVTEFQEKKVCKECLSSLGSKAV